MSKLSSCNWVFYKNELSPWKATYILPLHHWTIHHSTVWLYDSPYEGGSVPAQFKGHISRLMCKGQYKKGGMITKSSKLWWIELDTGMYSPLLTTIPQASKSSLGLVKYGCLQGCRIKKCSSPVYDPLCLWWQLWTLHFCKLIIVFKIGNVQ